MLSNLQSIVHEVLKAASVECNTLHSGESQRTFRVNKVLSYSYHNFEDYQWSCLLFKTQLNSIGLSGPITILDIVYRQVNAFCRIVTMVY
jgi:hypothetical protein